METIQVWSFESHIQITGETSSFLFIYLYFFENKYQH